MSRYLVFKVYDWEGCWGGEGIKLASDDKTYAVTQATNMASLWPESVSFQVWDIDLMVEVYFVRGRGRG